MIKGDMILVKWVDIQGSEGWEDGIEFATKKLPIITSPGIFINEDENCIRVAHDLADDGDLIGAIFPKGCVLEIVSLERSK